MRLENGINHDEESLKKMEEDLEARINGPTSFNRLLDKI